MSPTRRTNIITVLVEMLKRDPTEDEIQNAQTDTVVMGRVLLIELGI